MVVQLGLMVLIGGDTILLMILSALFIFKVFGKTGNGTKILERVNC